jgi:hypothetical protein
MPLLFQPRFDVCCGMQKLWMRHLPDLGLVGGPVANLVCIVTGPTSGIGTQTASELARRGAHGTLAAFSWRYRFWF